MRTDILGMLHGTPAHTWMFEDDNAPGAPYATVAQLTQHVTASSCVASPTVHGSCHGHIDTHPIAQALQNHSDLQTLLAAHLGHAAELGALNPAPPAARRHKVFGCSAHSALQLL